MPQGPARIASFLHPLAAVAAVALLGYAASLGLRSRERGGAALRPRHARLAPWAYASMLFSMGFGSASTWLWRPDLELAAGAHFRLGVVLVALLTAAALLSQRIALSDAARRIHPWLGLAGLLLAAVQVFFGLGLLAL